MASVRGRIVLYPAAVDRLVGPSGPVGRFVAGTGRRVENRAKVLAPVDTGNLRASITGALSGGGRRTTYTVGTPVSYAMAVHEGTRAHVITPKRAKVLRFRVGGTWVYARRVHHPGTKPRPFLRDALDVARAEGYRIDTT